MNTSNPDWNEDRGGYGRGYQDHGYENERGNYNYGNEGNIGYGTSIGGRYSDHGSVRGYNDRGGYSENQYSRDSGFNRGRYMGDRDEGYSRSGNDYLNYGSERGVNDRGWDEDNRSNYERRNYNRGGGNFGGGSYGSDYNRGRREYDNSDERGWWDRTSDEVSSWFGDEDAERRREQDKRRSGQHRGKGPKGYSRSDDRIKEDINDRLSDDVFIDASEIEVTVSSGEVTLTGSVGTRIEKRRAEDIAEEVSAVKNVENRLRLASMQGGGYSSGLGSTTSETSTSERGKTKQTF